MGTSLLYLSAAFLNESPNVSVVKARPAQRKPSMPASRIKAVVTLVALAGVGGASPAARAQTVSGQGMQAAFGLALRLEGEDNRAFAPSSAGNSLEATADLTFGVLTETRSSRFSFDASGSLRSLDSPTERSQEGFVNPSLAFSYGRDAAATQLALSGSLSETSLADTDVLSEDGLTIVTSGAPTRRTGRLEGAIDWGINSPFGYGLLARIDDTAYRGGTASGLDGTALNDNRRTTVEGTTRIDLSKAVELQTKLAFSNFKEEGAPPARQTITFSNRLTLDRPLGSLTADLNLAHTEDGSRFETALGRQLEMPLGEIAGQVGVARGTNGETYLTGRLNYGHSLPRGALNVGLSRDIASDNEEDSERISTRLSFSYLQELTRASSFRFAANWAEFEDSGTGLETSNATLEAIYSYEVTRDWSLDTGYRHDYRAGDSLPSAGRSNALFLEVRRTFTGSF